MILTKQIREQIIDAAIAKSELPKHRAKVKADIQKLGKLAYSLAVKVPKEVAALPAEVKAAWLQSVTSLEILSEGFSRNYNCEARDAWRRQENLPSDIKLDDPVLVGRYFGSVKAADHPKLKASAETVLAAHRAANAYEDDLRAQLRAIVAAANTSDQLLKTWPECKPFLPPETVKSRALVDTKTVDSVNKILNLP